ncbi:MAG TPA: glycosyltransferase family 4 protein [Blastocatellia bacterium]|jgi:glycosyltransferase involved in cell wall biosynthesis|nr:glycosyltransferase family 4 protein [Blastocatellia bacterium]
MKTVVSVFGIEPARIGGAEAYARELSVQLGERGWQSVLCFLKEPPESVRAYLELPNVSIEVIEDSWKTRWRAIRGLARILQKHRPQILHLHFTGFISSYPWLARVFSVKQIFFTDHSSNPEGHVIRRASLWKRVAARAINWPMTRVITVSEYGFRCFAGKDLVPRHRLAMVYNSADLSRASADRDSRVEFKSKYSIPEDRTLVAQVSWMIPEKGIADLLEAAKFVIARNAKVHFALIGEGARRREYTNRAAAMGLANNVTFTGQVEDPMGSGVYAAADIVCQVSRWEEVFGYVIAEAMSCGKPMVATRVGGIPELVEDEKTGFVVERGNAAAIADRILRLVTDPALRERMGAAGRQAARTKFDLEQNAERVVELYGIATSERATSTCESLAPVALPQ